MCLLLASPEISALGQVPPRCKLSRTAWIFCFHGWLLPLTKQQAFSDSRILRESPTPLQPRPVSCLLPMLSLGPGDAYRACSSHLHSPSAPGSKGNILKELFSLPVWGTGLPKASNFIHSFISHSQCWQRGQETPFSSCCKNLRGHRFQQAQLDHMHQKT